MTNQLAEKTLAFNFNTIMNQYPKLGEFYNYNGIVKIFRNTFLIVNYDRKSKSKSLILLHSDNNRVKVVRSVDMIDSLSLLNINKGKPSYNSNIAISRADVKGRITIYDQELRKAFFMGHFKRKNCKSNRKSFFYRTDVILEKREYGGSLVDFMILKNGEVEHKTKPLFIKTFDKLSKKILIQRYFDENRTYSNVINNLAQFLIIYSHHKLNQFDFKNASDIIMDDKFNLSFSFQGSMMKRDHRYFRRCLNLTENLLKEFLDNVQGMVAWMKKRIKLEDIMKIGCVEVKGKN